MQQSRRSIPHVQQSASLRNCGAACLAMLMQSYGKHADIEEITERISIQMPNGFRSCRNSLMLQFARGNGLICCGVSVKGIRETISTCLQKGIDVIISYHPAVWDPGGHFSVVVACDNDGVLINDPMLDENTTKGKRISFRNLEILMQPFRDRREIVIPNTMILLAPEEDGQSYIQMPSLIPGADRIPVFACISNQVTAYLDPAPEDGLWLEYKPFGSPAPA